MNETWCQMSTMMTVQIATLVLPSQFTGSMPMTAQEIVHDAERRMQEHSPDQSDDDRIHEQRTEQDAVVERLEALHRVEHERHEKPDGEFEEHHRQHEERRDAQAVHGIQDRSAALR